MEGHERRHTRPRSRRVALPAVGVLLAGVVPALWVTGTANAIVAGAGYTTSLTEASCVAGSMVNCNAYTSKDDVYLSGGPTAGGIRTAGDYYFAVIAPGSQNTFFDGTGLLSTDTQADRRFRVGFDGRNPIIDENLGTHAHATNAAGKFVIQAKPFADTPNPGGVYIMAICQVGATNASDCKYDAFRIVTADSPVPQFGVVHGSKYYDADLDGRRDAGEPGIEGWKIDFTDGISGTFTTDADGAFTASLEADRYTFTERQSSNTNWYQTGNTVDQTGAENVSLSNFVYTVDVVDDSVTSGLHFGNVCKVVSTGGRTMGYWANAGNPTITAGDLAALSALNLVTESGAAFDPTSAAQVKTFLNGVSSVNAKNMAFMLSGQITALTLNVRHGNLTGTDTVLNADGTPYLTVQGIISDASSRIGTNPVTTTKVGHAARPAQERLKNVADGLNQNNGLSVVPGTLGAAMTRCGAPAFAP